MFVINIQDIPKFNVTPKADDCASNDLPENTYNFSDF